MDVSHVRSFACKLYDILPPVLEIKLWIVIELSIRSFVYQQYNAMR